MSDPIRILYVDDYPLDRKLVRDALEKEHEGFRVTEAASRQEFEALLAEGDYDLILSDFNILGFEGLEVIDAVRAKDPRVPVVIVTGTGTEEVAVEAMKRGATDYVIKTPEHTRRLPHTIQAAIEKKRLRDERKRAEEALRKSRNLMQSVIDGSPDQMMLIDRDYGILLANRAVRDVLGGEDLVSGSLTCHQISHHRDTPCEGVEHPCPLEHVIATKAPVTVTHTHYDAEGNVVYSEVNAAPIFDEAGEVIQIIESSRDITQRVRAEEALRQHREHLEELVKERTAELEIARDKAQRYLDIAGVIIVTIDAEQRVALINQRGCAVLRGTVEEIVGKNWFETFIPENVREDVVKAFRQLLTGEIEFVEYFENLILTRDGKERLIAWHNTLLKDNAGNIIGTLSSGEDITERKQAEEQLRLRTEELEVFNEAMVDREMRIIEMKEQVNRLCEELGWEPTYPPIWLEDLAPEQKNDRDG